MQLQSSFMARVDASSTARPTRPGANSWYSRKLETLSREAAASMLPSPDKFAGLQAYNSLLLSIPILKTREAGFQFVIRAKYRM